MNAIFNELGKPAIDRTRMDEVNAGIAEYEASLRSDSAAAFTHLQPEGNYALDVIAATLHVYGSLALCKATLDGDGVPLPGTYLVGDGHHWQVLCPIGCGLCVGYGGVCEPGSSDLCQLGPRPIGREWQWRQIRENPSAIILLSRGIASKMPER